MTVVPDVDEADDSSTGPRARLRSPVVTLLALLLVVVAVAAWWWTSPRMLEVVDSAGYIGAADNLADGRGLTTPFALATERAGPAQQVSWGTEIPLSEWPPGYPAALAVVGSAGLSAFDAARVISVVGLIGLGAASFGALWLATRSGGVAVIGTVLVMVGHTTETYLGPGAPLGWSGVIASERLFLPLALGALVVAALPSEPGTTGERVRLSALFVLVVAAVLTRYPGVACGVAAATVILLDHRRPLRRRLGLAGALAAAVLGSTLLPGLVAGGSPKVVAWHPVPLLRPVVDTMGAWFMVPESWLFGLRVVLVVLLVAGPVAVVGVRTVRRALDRGPLDASDRIDLSLAVFLVVYSLVVVVTCLLLDAAVPPEQRLFGPVQVVAYLLVLSVLHRAGRLALSRAPRARPAAVDVAVIAVALALAAVPLWDLRSGHDYLTVLGRAQVAVRDDLALAEVAPDTIFFTDETSTVWTATGNPTYVLPSRVVLTTMQDNPDYEDQVDEVVAIVRDRDGLVVVFASGTGPGPQDLEERGLVVFGRCAGATVLGRPGSAHAAVAGTDGCRTAS